MNDIEKARRFAARFSRAYTKACLYEAILECEARLKNPSGFIPDAIEDAAHDLAILARAEDLLARDERLTRAATALPPNDDHTAGCRPK